VERKQLILKDFSKKSSLECSLECELSAENYLSFSVSGEINLSFKKSLSKEELWKSSCFELFEFSKDSEEYLEWNFSDTRKYLRIFSSYRVEGSLSSSLKEVSEKAEFSFRQNQDSFSFQFQVKRNFINSDFKVALILENQESTLSYFALDHGTLEKPDFHRKNFGLLSL